MTHCIAQALPLASPDVAGLLVVTLIVVGVVLVAALLFGGWVIVTIVRAIAGMLAPKPRVAAAPAAAPNRVRCGQPNCLADNPARAQFCRRCGRTLHAGRPAVPAPARRVAML